MQSALGFFFCFCFLSIFCLFFLLFSIIVRKTRAHRTSSSTFAPSFDSERFFSEKNHETFEKLNIRRNVSTERKVVLDELDRKLGETLSVGVGCLCWMLIILLQLP